MNAAFLKELSALVEWVKANAPVDVANRAFTFADSKTYKEMLAGVKLPASPDFEPPELGENATCNWMGYTIKRKRAFEELTKGEK